MCPRVSVTPACSRNVSATYTTPFSSRQNATGLASSGSAANSSTFSPSGTRKRRTARIASSEAGEIFGAYAGAVLPVAS